MSLRKKNIFVFLLSSHLPSASTARFKHVFGRLQPSGFFFSALSESFRFKRTTFKDYDVCLSNMIRFPDQHFSGISLNQCEKLMMTVVFLSVTSLITLLVEIPFKRMQTK